MAREVTESMGLGPGFGAPARHRADCPGSKLRGDGTNAIDEGEGAGSRAPASFRLQSRHRAELAGHLMAKIPETAALKSPGRSRLCSLEFWVQVLGHLVLACSAGAAADPQVPEGPLSLASSLNCHGTTLTPCSFLRPP